MKSEKRKENRRLKMEGGKGWEKKRKIEYGKRR